MRVVIEVASGPHAGRKAWLSAGQRLEVGRTAHADFSLPRDGRMSNLHFALGTDQGGCYLEDLGSTNGTLLNELPVSEKSALCDGDRIQAGETDFVIQVEGQLPQEDARPATHSAGRHPAVARRITRPSPGDVTYSVETTNSKLVTYRGETGQIPPAHVALLLNQVLPLYLVVDFGKLGEQVPAETESPEYLFPWFPEESRATFSQTILSGTDAVDLFALIEKAWGHDALVCIFSKEERSELLQHLLRTAGAFARPSILMPHVQLAGPEGAQVLFAGLGAVLLEGPSAAEWMMIAGDEFDATLNKLGFSHLPGAAA